MQTISSVILLGKDLPTRCDAFVRIMNVATVPNNPPITIEPTQSGIGELSNELKEIAVRATNTPVTAAVSSKRTTFKLGSALDRTK